jgi:hypothetical protein
VELLRGAKAQICLEMLVKKGALKIYENEETGGH